ncbi:mitochondrial ribosomal protein S28 [Rhynchophorus ferrugineus]|uniref:mitochondrial ribosomal protein S28 n=1 Tax=Rhynchophorus ferrugineus TaxID=354439 RepID=UPI003FCC7F7A
MFRFSLNKILGLRRINVKTNCCKRLLSVDNNVETSETNAGGFAESYKKFEKLNKPQNEEPKTFSSLLKNSKFIDMGDPEGKVVIGRIFHVVGDDLYIDFGWKFHCVCTRPQKNSQEYKRGSKVRLRIHELEICSKFLGYEKELTLLEADCTLLGLVQERK